MNSQPVASIEISGDPNKLSDSLSTIRSYVMTASQAASLDKQAANRLRLAIDEVATNIINYGYGRAGLQGIVKLSTLIDTDKLILTLEDTAVAFNPHQHQLPTNFDAPPDERPIGGLGVFLAMKNVDAWDYEYLNNSNINRFTMKRPSGASSQ
ncbi:MAG: ATP-binding protein [Chloroflexota bacterium]